MNHSGSGTASYSISGSYSSFRGTLVYKDFHNVSHTKSISGVKGGNVSVTDSDEITTPCSASTSATLSFMISSGWSFNGTTDYTYKVCSYQRDKNKYDYYYVYAQLKEAKITMLEVYR